MIYEFTRKELKNKKASDFKDMDIISVGKYLIYIRYKTANKEYDIPSLLSYVEDTKLRKFLDCTPGIGWPYYIADFIGR